MLKTTSYCILALALLGVWSCEPEPIFEPSTSVEIQWRGFYGDEILVFPKPNGYYFNDTVRLRFSEFGFYFSEVKLIGDDGVSETNLIDVDWVDFSTFGDSLTANQGAIFSLRRIPVGNYTGIKFGFGVSPFLNETLPEEYFESHSLSATQRYRPSWESYVFSRIGGRADTDGDLDFLDLAYLYRSGTNDQYRTIVLPLNLELEADKTGRIPLIIDLETLLSGSGGVPILTDQGGDPATQLNIGAVITSNVEQAIKVGL